MNNDMFDFVLKNYGDIIKEYLGNNIGISFYNGVENYFDTFKNIKSKLITKSDENSFTTTIYADYSADLTNKITDCVIGTIKSNEKEYTVIKFMTPFTMTDTYDFIVFKNDEADELFEILKERKSKSNFSFDISKNPVIGLDLKEIERNTVNFLLDEDFRKYCKSHFIKLKRGIILSGKPGTGKSMTLKYLKNVALKNNIAFHSFSGAQDFFENQNEFYNDDNKIFVFEDFDTMLQDREKTNNAPNEVLGTILNKLDGVNDINNVISIFTTNEIGIFDKAFIRPGRIDKVFTYNMPTIKDRIEFFKAYIPEEQEFYDEMNAYASKKSTDVSFAILKGICDDINIYKFYTTRDKTMQSLNIEMIKSIINEKLSSANKSAEVNNTDKYIL